MTDNEIKEMEECREELNKLIAQYGTKDERVLKASKKLDCYVARRFKEMNEHYFKKDASD